MIRWELTKVTPVMAAAWLEKNDINRKLREHRAADLARAMREGKFQVTHEGIGISKHGRLIDGQHRMRAVILANKTIAMWIAFNCEETTFSVLNAGLPRKMFERLKTDPRHTAIASSLWRFTQREVMATWEASLMLDIFRPAFNRMDASPRPARNKVSKATQEAAFALRLAIALKAKDEDAAIRICWILEKLRRGDIAGLPPICAAYYLQIMAGGPKNPEIGVSEATDSFIRAWSTLDVEREGLSKLQINDHSGEMKEARAAFNAVTERVFE